MRRARGVAAVVAAVLLVVVATTAGGPIRAAGPPLRFLARPPRHARPGLHLRCGRRPAAPPALCRADAPRRDAASRTRRSHRAGRSATTGSPIGSPCATTSPSATARRSSPRTSGARGSGSSTRRPSATAPDVLSVVEGASERAGRRRRRGRGRRSRRPTTPPSSCGCAIRRRTSSRSPPRRRPSSSRRRPMPPTTWQTAGRVRRQRPVRASMAPRAPTSCCAPTSSTSPGRRRSTRSAGSPAIDGDSATAFANDEVDLAQVAGLGRHVDRVRRRARPAPARGRAAERELLRLRHDAAAVRRRAGPARLRPGARSRAPRPAGRGRVLDGRRQPRPAGDLAGGFAPETRARSRTRRDACSTRRGTRIGPTSARSWSAAPASASARRWRCGARSSGSTSRSR